MDKKMPLISRSHFKMHPFLCCKLSSFLQMYTERKHLWIIHMHIYVDKYILSIEHSGHHFLGLVCLFN